MAPTVGPAARRSTAAAVAGIALGAMTVQAGVITAMVAPSVVGLLLLVPLVGWLIQWPADPLARRSVLRWTVAAFFAHLAAGLLITGLAETFTFLQSDAVGYHRLATSIVDHWTTGAPAPALPGGKEGFYYLLAGLYRVFGPYWTAGLAVNAVLAAALVPVAADLTYRLFGVAAARWIPPLVVLMPGIFIWTSQLLKEAAVLLLIAVAANAAVRVTEKVALGSLTMGTASLAVLLTFRGPVGLIVAGGLLAGIAFGKRELFKSLGTGLTALALFAVLVFAVGLGYSGFRTATSSDLRHANTVRQDLAVSARSGFDANVDVSTTRRALTYLPTGLVNFGLGPFPWQVRGAVRLAAIPDVAVWWILLPSLWRGFRAASGAIGRRVLVLVLPAVAVSTVMALVIGNYGTVVRERAQVVVLVVPLIALGLTQPRRRGDDRGGVREDALVHA